MSDPDIRWIQRFQNYRKALSRLREAVELSRTRSLSDLEQQGLVQAFEFTHELAWNTLKDFLEARGSSEKIYGSRDATRLAFQAGLIEEGETWMSMIVHRNQTTHTYNDATIRSIVSSIVSLYYGEFEAMELRFGKLEEEGRK